MIEAMKQALKALEFSCPTQAVHMVKHQKAWEALRQAIEQAKKQQALDKKAENARELGLDYEPPKREWVGLTDEEIALVCAECAASAHNWNDISFARAIEAKLKEKNT